MTDIKNTGSAPTQAPYSLARETDVSTDRCRAPPEIFSERHRFLFSRSAVVINGLEIQ